MKVRLGYACNTVTLDITSCKTTTYTNYASNPDLNKLDNLIVSNLINLKKLLIYNLKNDIHFFRISSGLIPLATKKEVEFDYIKKYQKYYDEINYFLKDIRVDFHPDQYTVLNSVKKEVIENSINNLEYHYNLLKAMNVPYKLILLHVGSSVFGKAKSIERFIKTFKTLPIHLQKCIAIENDDKVYNIEDCLCISKKIDIPVVLDYHHHICNKSDTDIMYLLESVFKSWNGINPKMHFSSPKSKLKKEFRTHHDYINVFEFIDFLKILKSFDKNVDIMIEAKKKDEALFKLIRELKYYTTYKIDGTTITL